MMRRPPQQGLAPGAPEGKLTPSDLRALTKGTIMDTLFDQLRLATAALFCGGGLMMAALLIADLARF